MMARGRSSPPSVGRALSIGLIGGIAGAIVMAMFAMIAATTYQHHGLFTPLYHIATLFLTPTHLMTSVERAGAGDAFTFFPGPAVLGLLIHLAVGAAYGVVFALLIRALRLGGAALVPVGILFGGAAVLFSSFVGLPVAASLFDAGEPIRDMPTLAGWVTFTVEHLIFGLVLGVVAAVLLRPGVARADVALQHAAAPA
jgi:hypothetical protein